MVARPATERPRYCAASHIRGHSSYRSTQRDSLTLLGSSEGVNQPKQGVLYSLVSAYLPPSFIFLHEALQPKRLERARDYGYTPKAPSGFTGL